MPHGKELSRKMMMIVAISQKNRASRKQKPRKSSKRFRKQKATRQGESLILAKALQHMRAEKTSGHKINT